LIAADIEGEKINDYNFNKNQIIFFGSESNGFSDNLSQKITEKITIPRYNKNVDSLNVANSVAIVLSELKHKTTGK
jgi:TrmH family RNA methyltransferase